MFSVQLVIYFVVAFVMRTSYAIVGGENTIRPSYFCILKYNNGTKYVFGCGCVVIAEFYVMSVAHCNIDNQDVIVAFYSSGDPNDPNIPNVNVVKIDIHPQYNPTFNT